MRKDFISEVQETCFYVSIPGKQYGVIINIKDIDKLDEIMDYFYNDERNKKSIEAWKREWEEGVA